VRRKVHYDRDAGVSVRLGLPVEGAERLPTAIDLFSGVGGTALGLEWAGFDLRLAVDFDPAKAMWLARNHPGRRVLGIEGTEGDLTKLRPDQLLSEARVRKRELGLLVGCPPCQGFSLQGNREVEDERNYLYRRYLEMVREIEPAAVGFENVPGIETLGDGRFISDLLSELDSLGYNVRAIRANARRFGVPQDRERLFVVGVSQGKPPRPREREKERRVGPAIADLPERALVPRETESVAVPYAAEPGSGYAEALRTADEDPGVRNCEVSRHDDGILSRFRDLEPGDVDPATHHRRLREDKPSTTLTAGTPSRTACRPIHPSKDRVLTVREAARLTSFPDWYRFPRQIAEAWCLIGNAVPPLMAREIFRPVWEQLAFG
jgi:DNA (cytosine-5)-methyltransferase 1